jgi:peptide chain release factor
MNAGFRGDEVLLKRMKKLGIKEEDLDEIFTKGSGSGGQKINKTSSVVLIKYALLGIEVRCDESRSQVTNRILCREKLCEKIEKQRRDAKLEKQQEREKEKRQTRGRPAKVRREISQGKKHRSEIKKTRGKVDF